MRQNATSSSGLSLKWRNVWELKGWLAALYSGLEPGFPEDLGNIYPGLEV